MKRSLMLAEKFSNVSDVQKADCTMSSVISLSLCGSASILQEALETTPLGQSSTLLMTSLVLYFSSHCQLEKKLPLIL